MGVRRPPKLPLIVEHSCGSNRVRVDKLRFPTGVLTNNGDGSVDINISANTAVQALNNAAESRLLTVSCSDNELDAEANLTYDGATFIVGDHMKTNDNVEITGSLDVSRNIVATTYGTRSSIRYKKDVEPIKGSLDTILSMTGVKFTWKDSNKKDIGFIAEHVGLVLPEVVEWDRNGRDAESIRYSNLTALLVEAIKEQQKEIISQKKDIVKLEEIIVELDLKLRTLAKD